MQPVSILDQVVIQLRRQLEARDRRPAGTGPAASASPSGAVSLPGAVGAASAAVHEAGGDAYGIGRIAVEQMLGAEFGPEVVNDAEFQQVVDQVTGMLRADSALWDEFMAVLDTLARR